MYFLPGMISVRFKNIEDEYKELQKCFQKKHFKKFHSKNILKCAKILFYKSVSKRYKILSGGNKVVSRGLARF